MSAAEIYGMTNRLLQEYTVTQEIPHQLQNTQSAQHRWVPLPNGWYKVNANGAIFSKHKWTGIGVVVRDNQGQVVVVMSKKLELPLGPLEIEAKAMETIAIFAKDIGIQQAIFESDNLMICSTIQGDSKSLPNYCQHYCRYHTSHANATTI